MGQGRGNNKDSEMAGERLINESFSCSEATAGNKFALRKQMSSLAMQAQSIVVCSAVRFVSDRGQLAHSHSIERVAGSVRLVGWLLLLL